MAVFVSCQRVINEWIQCEDTSQGISDFVVSLEIETEVGMIKSRSDVWIIVVGLPFSFPESVLIDREFESGVMGAETFHLEMMMPKIAIMGACFNHDVVVGEPSVVLPICLDAA